MTTMVKPIMKNTFISFSHCGGAEVLELKTGDIGSPSPDSLLVRHTAVGVNFIDIYHRTGAFPLAEMPSGLGVEAVGVVEATGHAVQSFQVGDRVAYINPAPGSYATRRLVPADRAVHIPDAITDEQAAAVFFRGVTAHMLVQFTYVVGPADAVVVHAAGSGVGALVTRWAKHLGATVIGTVSRLERVQSAKDAGADYVVVSSAPGALHEIQLLSRETGISAVFDGVGAATLALTLAVLRPFGTWVSFGQASGPLPEINVLDLGPRRSLTLVRPGVFAYTSQRERLQHAAGATFELALRNILNGSVVGRFPLEQAAAAHRAFESPAVSGTVLLVPSV